MREASKVFEELLFIAKFHPFYLIRLAFL